MAKKETQFTVLMKNEPGKLSHLADMISQSEINILGISAYTNGEFGVVRFVADNVKKVRALLNNSDYSNFYETNVVSHQIVNTPGALSMLSKLLGRKKINIDNLYCSTSEAGQATTIFLAVSDVEGTLGELNKGK